MEKKVEIDCKCVRIRFHAIVLRIYKRFWPRDHSENKYRISNVKNEWGKIAGSSVLVC